MDYRVEIDDRLVGATLDELIQRTETLFDPMDAIGFGLSEQIRDTFDDQSNPWGVPWAPLSDVTISRRRKGKGTGGDKALLDTGRLRNSISYVSDGNSVAIFADPEYAATQQYGAKKGEFGRTSRGGPIPWGDIPAREFFPIRNDRLDLPGDWEEGIFGVLNDYLRKITGVR